MGISIVISRHVPVNPFVLGPMVWIQEAAIDYGVKQ